MKSRHSKTKPARRTRRLPQECARYTEMKGRTVDQIEVWLSPGYQCVSIRFEDKTDFTVEIDCRMIFHAMHSDWKSGNQRVLKRWPAQE